MQASGLCVRVPSLVADHERTDDDEERAVERDDYETNPDESGKWLSAIIALIGVWMIVEPFLFVVGGGQFWNDVLVGVLLVAVGGYNYYRRTNKEVGSVAAASIAVLLGLWLVIAPFVIGAGTEAGGSETVSDFAFWNDIVVGLITIAIGAFSVFSARSERSDVPRTAS